MRNPISAALLTLSAGALALGLGATSASAAPLATWTVSPGGSISGAAGTTTLKDTTANLTITCTTSTSTGTLKSGSGLSGTGIGTVTNIAFNNCTVDGQTLSISTGTVAFPLNAVSYSAGVTHGTISKIHIVVSSSICSLVIDGTSGSADNGKVKVTYSNTTHKLTILPSGGNLHTWNVSGCLGLIANGNAGTVSTKYAITPAQKITSP